MKSYLKERADYVSLMKLRALGLAPEMGSALRMAEVIESLVQKKSQKHLRIIDIGCATGHYLRSIAQRLPDSTIDYVGIDIDENMLEAGKEAWAKNAFSFPKLNVHLHHSSVDELSSRSFDPADYVICANAFMYFKRPQVALKNMLNLTNSSCIIRGYFGNQTIIVKRAIPKETHYDSDIPESEILDEDGEPRRFDLWNIYSFSYFETLVQKLGSSWQVHWEEDRNPVNSMEGEKKVGIQKFEGTQIWNGQEIVYPLILPWKYAIISKTT